MAKTIDVFLVGGGGGGEGGSSAGGGGGYTTTQLNLAPKRGNYTVTVGAGGAGSAAYPAGSPVYGSNGQASSFIGNGTNLTANGGTSGKNGVGANGGDGGSGGGGWNGVAGAFDGGSTIRGVGQGTTTKEFGEVGGALYSDGGGGGGDSSGGAGGNGGGGAGRRVDSGLDGGNGTPNSGGGGGSSAYNTGGASRKAGDGGSGIVKIRYKTADFTGCTGGTITIVGDTTYHTFTSSGTFFANVPASSGFFNFF